MKWISINTSLPIMFKCVLVYGYCDRYLLGRYQIYQVRRWSGLNSPYEEEHWSWLNTRDELVTGITHWMELIEKPELVCEHAWATEWESKALRCMKCDKWYSDFMMER